MALNLAVDQVLSSLPQLTLVSLKFITVLIYYFVKLKCLSIYTLSLLYLEYKFDELIEGVSYYCDRGDPALNRENTILLFQIYLRKLV